MIELEEQHQGKQAVNPSSWGRREKERERERAMLCACGHKGDSEKKMRRGLHLRGRVQMPKLPEEHTCFRFCFLGFVVVVYLFFFRDKVSL